MYKIKGSSHNVINFRTMTRKHPEKHVERKARLIDPPEKDIRIGSSVTAVLPECEGGTLPKLPLALNIQT